DREHVVARRAVEDQQAPARRCPWRQRDGRPRGRAQALEQRCPLAARRGAHDRDAADAAGRQEPHGAAAASSRSPWCTRSAARRARVRTGSAGCRAPPPPGGGCRPAAPPVITTVAGPRAARSVSATSRSIAPQYASATPVCTAVAELRGGTLPAARGSAPGS